MFKIQHLKAKNQLILAILLACSYLLLAFTVNAQSLSTGWLTHPDHPPAQVRFMLTGEVDEKNYQARGLLEVNLDGEWKTYWRSPGEGGVSPILDWSQSSNLSGLEWYWPTPAFYEVSGIMTLGYKHNVVFPMLLTFDDINQPITFSGKLTLPTCTNICVLTDYDLDLAPILLADLETDINAQHLYQQGLSKVPTKSTLTQIIAASFDYDSQILQLKISHHGGWEYPQILVDGDQITDDYLSQATLDINGDIVTATYQVSNWLGKTDLVGKDISVTASDTLFAHELTTLIDDNALVKNSSTGIFSMIIFALLGGLVLNIMPCVLPVLGMKLNSVLASANNNKRTVRIQFLASAVGILTSFWLLATGLLILKITGSAIGWGIQFQNPFFIGFMVIITAIFTANLLGFFEVSLPSLFSTSIANKGNDSIIGHFVQGMFATLLATPCSAPFLGTAVAFALGASIFEMWMIFTFLGLGMAMPWLLFALFPSLISFMPKPGMWMNKVKIFFGLMMLLTTLWLLSLMTPFLGNLPTLMIALSLLLYFLFFIAKMHGKKTVIIILAAIVLASSSGLLIGSLSANHWATPLEDELVWEPLNENRIAEYVKQGKTVFVDVTADWCITCKVNKVGVILQDPVYSALQQENVVTMLGDWTRPSDIVTDYLRNHQRFGVPLNIVYGPNAPQGIPLPVILTSGGVIEALLSAGSPTQ